MSKISEFTTLTENDIAIGDMLPILDVSTQAIKKVSVNTLRGYHTGDVKTADIKSLCTSPHTIYSATARLVSPDVAFVSATLNGGTSGIGYVPDTSIFTIPQSLFSGIFTLTDLKVRSEQSPTAAYAMSINHCYSPYYFGLYSTLPASTNVQELHHLPDWAVTSSGKFKALIIYMLAFMKPGAVLPYSS